MSSIPRGTFDGEYTWPVMTPGATYLAAFPEYNDPLAATGADRKFCGKFFAYFLPFTLTSPHWVYAKIKSGPSAWHNGRPQP